jgi:hypothetical protein
MKIEGKNKSLILFFTFLWLPSILLFMLVDSSSLQSYIVTSFYVIVTLADITVLGVLLKSDDQYYRNFSFNYLIYAILAAVGMTVLSWGLSLNLNDHNMLLYLTFAKIELPFYSVTTTLLPMPNSVLMIVFALLASGLVLVAAGEELFKLTIFAEAKERWGKGYKIGAVTIPGVIIYVGFPIGFWSALHGILAYSDPLMIVPAFINGVVLIIYLWKTKCVLGCIFAHFLYNGALTILTVINGTAGIPLGTPLFPQFWTAAYWSNSGYIYDGLLTAIIIAALLLFLLPSLTKSGEQVKYHR